MILVNIGYVGFQLYFCFISNSRPDLSGALFVQQSGTKKRERRAEIVAKIKIHLQRKIDHSQFTFTPSF